MPHDSLFCLIFSTELKTMDSYPLSLSEATTEASGLLIGLLRESKPSPTPMNYVDRCLREKGYKVIGWN